MPAATQAQAASAESHRILIEISLLLLRDPLLSGRDLWEGSVVLPWYSRRLRQTLILDCRLEHGAVRHLADARALHLLPGCLTRRIRIAAVRLELATARHERRIVQQDIDAARPQIHSQAISA